MALLSLPVITILGAEILRDLRQLRSADSDTVQWTLSQVEIEYTDFQLSLERAKTETDLAQLRQDFDILYSRVVILQDGRVFAEVRTLPEFRRTVGKLQVFLDQTAEVIDSPNPALLAALPDLSARVDAQRPLARLLFNRALSHFADQSDRQRTRISNTLRLLGITIAASFAALVVLLLYSRTANARTRQRERELARANAHMQTILSTSLDAVIVSDHQGRVLDLNTAAERTFGYTLDTAKGKSIGDLIVPPELREAHRAGMARMIATGEKKLVGKGRVRLEAVGVEGQRIPVELALQSAQGESGEIIIAFLRDISAQLAAEEELRTARDQALAGEKAKADFLTVMSHEIRTPLTGLLGNLTLMGQSPQSPEQTQYIQNMEISGRQLMEHVNAVLDIAKFEAGKLEISPSTFDLGALLQDIVDGLSGQAERNRTQMSWGWEGAALTWVETDRAHLQQILMNLVGNAIKFTTDGAVQIEVEQSGAGTEKREIEFRIIDSGIGIPEEDQAQIFEDFETRDRSKGKVGGTGLGLGIARRLTSALGGEIGVESTPGEGSVFWVRIPITLAAAPSSPQAVAEGGKEQRPLTILLAEDNDINAFVARKMLSMDGHKVTLVQNGVDAVDRATCERFDVILMDIGMPGMDGLQATQAIRAAAEPYCATPILAFSANVLPEETERFRAKGMNGFIGKPLQQDEIRHALQVVQDNLRDTPTPVTEPAGDGGLLALLDADEHAQLTLEFRDEGDTLVALLELQRDGTPDFDLIVAECHRVASSAALFGADEFHQALRNLERAAKENDVAACHQNIDAALASWHAWRSETT